MCKIFIFSGCRFSLPPSSPPSSYNELPFFILFYFFTWNVQAKLVQNRLPASFKLSSAVQSAWIAPCGQECCSPRNLTASAFEIRPLPARADGASAAADAAAWGHIMHRVPRVPRAGMPRILIAPVPCHGALLFCQLPIWINWWAENLFYLWTKTCLVLYTQFRV